jgi:hypothetical protein
VGDPFERAWFVSEAEVIEDQAQTISRLSADEFDLRRRAVLAAPLNTPLDAMTAAEVTMIEFSPTCLTLQTRASGRHLLVVSQIYYPGWRAEIDGQSAELLRVNGVQQGVVVPEGAHVIRLTFWPTSFVRGLVFSIAALLMCVTAAAAAYLRETGV